MSAARSPLYDWHVAHGARMEACDGWQVPVDYGASEAERDAARNAVAVAERVGQGVIEVLGTGVGVRAETLGVGDAGVGYWEPLPRAPLPEAGRGESQVGVSLWCRLTRDHARVVSELGQPGPGIVTPEKDSCLHVCDVSSGVATLLVIGPRAPDLMARLVRLDLDPRVFSDGRVVLTGAVGVPVQILRRDRDGLLAYELMLGRDVAEYFADALLHAGDGLGLRLAGQVALREVTGDG